MKGKGEDWKREGKDERRELGKGTVIEGGKKRQRQRIGRGKKIEWKEHVRVREVGKKVVGRWEGWVKKGRRECSEYLLQFFNDFGDKLYSDYSMCQCLIYTTITMIKFN